MGLRPDWQLDSELTARHELQVELKKMEGDYDQKVKELSSEKEHLGQEKLEKENENQKLQEDIIQFKDQVLAHPHLPFFNTQSRCTFPHHGAVSLAVPYYSPCCYASKLQQAASLSKRTASSREQSKFKV